MTPEREREIRAVEAQCTGHPETDAIGLCLRDLLAEVDRLRRLPVVATCGECVWHRVTRVFADRVDYCGNPSAHNGDVGGADTEPPEWCPLRGGR